MLVVAGLLWGCSGKGNLTDRFEQARKIVRKVFHWQPPPGATYQGFTKMLHKWHAQLMLAVVPDVQVKMKEVLPGQWEIAGYVVYAADGSRIELARTEALEAFYSPQRKKQRKKKNKTGGRGRKNAAKLKAGFKRRAARKQSAEAVEKKVNSPQMWLTLVWHVGRGLPWSWQTGPSDSSERDHLVEMLSKLPENSLITADAGFVGYDFWKAILDAKHKFLIRVGGNVKLLKKLGYVRESSGTVYLWPDKAAKKKQPPLALRLIVVHNGKHPVYLVTNLPKSKLSDRQAAAIYSARWGIELFFRTFKQTFGRRKLRSRCPNNAKLEIDWSLLALWCICLLAQRELVNSGQSPSSLSPVSAIKAFQDILHDWRVRPENRGQSLCIRLRGALLDHYERTSSKTSRNYPRKKKEHKHTGPPKLFSARKQQVTAAKELKRQKYEIQLTA